MYSVSVQPRCFALCCELSTLHSDGKLRLFYSPLAEERWGFVLVTISWIAQAWLVSFSVLPQTTVLPGNTSLLRYMMIWWDIHRSTLNDPFFSCFVVLFSSSFSRNRGKLHVLQTLHAGRRCGNFRIQDSEGWVILPVLWWHASRNWKGRTNQSDSLA